MTSATVFNARRDRPSVAQGAQGVARAARPPPRATRCVRFTPTAATGRAGWARRGRVSRRGARDARRTRDALAMVLILERWEASALRTRVCARSARGRVGAEARRQQIIRVEGGGRHLFGVSVWAIGEKWSKKFKIWPSQAFPLRDSRPHPSPAHAAPSHHGERRADRRLGRRGAPRGHDLQRGRLPQAPAGEHPQACPPVASRSSPSPRAPRTDVEARSHPPSYPSSQHR